MIAGVIAYVCQVPPTVATLECGLDELARVEPKELLRILADSAERALGYWQAACPVGYLNTSEELPRAIVPLRSCAEGKCDRKIDCLAAALAAESACKRLHARVITTIYGPQVAILDHAVGAIALALEAAADIGEDRAYKGACHQARRSAEAREYQELIWQAEKVQTSLAIYLPKTTRVGSDRLRLSLLAE